jgi:hypothetical protein
MNGICIKIKQNTGNHLQNYKLSTQEELKFFMHPQNFSYDCFWPGYISAFSLSKNNYLQLETRRPDELLV